MKALIVFFVTFISFSGISQNWDQKYEASLYNIAHNGAEAQLTTITSNIGPFSPTDYTNFEAICATKDGFIKLKLVGNGGTIQVYHLNWIDVSSIEQMFFGLNEDLEYNIYGPVTIDGKVVNTLNEDE